jgi:hypothetical protein
MQSSLMWYMVDGGGAGAAGGAARGAGAKAIVDLRPPVSCGEEVYLRDVARFRARARRKGTIGTRSVGPLARYARSNEF